MSSSGAHASGTTAIWRKLVDEADAPVRDELVFLRGRSRDRGL